MNNRKRIAILVGQADEGYYTDDRGDRPTGERDT